ncbi:MAG: MFS transporter [Alphaproteobacteria bacterium]|nr:MFS transporter [Alphaproteobacteria bacterium]
MTMATATAARTPRIAWLIWGLSTLCFTYAFFHRVAPSVMVADLMRDFAVGGAILGNLSAVYFYTYAGLQIPVGIIIDRWGPRLVLTCAILVASIGSFLFAGSESLSAAYVGRLLIGAGVAFGFVGGLALATNWFPARRFAMLSGLTMLGGMAGGVLGQAPQAAVVEVIGWRETVLWTGGAGVVLALLLWLIVRDRPASAAAEAENIPVPTVREVLAGLGRVLRNPQTWIIAVFGGMMSGPMLAFGALWGVPYLMESHELSRPAAAFSASLLMVGWALGGPVLGWWSDHIGRRKVPMYFGACLGLASILAILYLPGLPLPAVQALLVLNGVGGASMIISYVAAREHNPGPSGVAYGFTNMASVSGGALFQPLIGWLLDLNWDGAIVDGARVYSGAAYDVALFTLPACFAGALLFALLIRETYCRPVIRK